MTVFRDDILKWDMDETAKGGPFQEILDVDIFVNCIYLTSKIPSFLTPEQITAAGSSRKLSVVVDVSCDTTNPNNPIPIYSINTTLTSSMYISTTFQIHSAIKVNYFRPYKNKINANLPVVKNI